MPSQITKCSFISKQWSTWLYTYFVKWSVLRYPQNISSIGFYFRLGYHARSVDRPFQEKTVFAAMTRTYIKDCGGLLALSVRPPLHVSTNLSSIWRYIFPQTVFLSRVQNLQRPNSFRGRWRYRFLQTDILSRARNLQRPNNFKPGINRAWWQFGKHFLWWLHLYLIHISLQPFYFILFFIDSLWPSDVIWHHRT